MQMKFLRLLSKSAFQEMTYSCTDLDKGCMVDLKGDNEMVVNNSDKINLDVTEVGSYFWKRGGTEDEFEIILQYRSHSISKMVLRWEYSVEEA